MTIFVGVHGAGSERHLGPAERSPQRIASRSSSPGSTRRPNGRAA